MLAFLNTLIKNPFLSGHAFIHEQINFVMTSSQRKIKLVLQRKGPFSPKSQSTPSQGFQGLKKGEDREIAGKEDEISPLSIIFI